MDPEARLETLGITLPDAPAPVAAYVPSVRTGNLLTVSGQVPMVDGRPGWTGLVPDEVDVEEARAAARQCAINGLAVAKEALGSLRVIRRVVRVEGFVACPSSFHGHPQVVNGASELMLDVFGERGRHARFAVGASSLPLGVPVEVAFLFDVE